MSARPRNGQERTAKPTRKPRKRKAPIVLLVRRVVSQSRVWLLHSEHQTIYDAEDAWRRRIKGQGVTAWSWWGPRRIAEKMLADPAYDPDTDAVKGSQP